jgi:hypothetical protein
VVNNGQNLVNVVSERPLRPSSVVLYLLFCFLLLLGTVLLEKCTEVMIILSTDYGRPMKPFSLKSQTFGLGQTNWADKFWGIWGIFGRIISTHFPLINYYFYKKLSLFIQIPNIYLGLWDLNLGRKELGI